MRRPGLALAVAVVAATALLLGGVLPWTSNAATALLALAGAAALVPVLRGRAGLSGDPLLLAAGLAVAGGLASLPASVSPFATLEWLRLALAAAAVAGLCAHLPASRREARLAVFALLASALLASLYGLAVTLAGSEVVLWVRKADYRDSLTGTFINRNHFAGWLALHLYAGLGAALEAGRRWRLLLLVPLALGALALALTLSRGGLLAAALSAPLFLALAGGRARRRAAAACAAVLVLACGALAATNLDRLRDRIQGSFASESEPSAAARLSMWRSTLRAFAERPLLGHGAGTFASFYPRHRELGITRRVTHAHQDWLELLAEQGLAGGLAAAGALVLVAAAARRSLRAAGPDRPLVAGLWAGVITVLLQAAVDFPFRIPAVLFATAAAAGLAVALGRSEAAEPTPGGTRAARVAALAAALLLLAGAARSLQRLAAEGALARGDSAFSRPDWEEAARHFARAVAIDPLDPRAHYGLGRAVQNLGKFRARADRAEGERLRDAALAHHARAEALDRMSADYNLERAWLLNFAGRLDEAEREYDLALGDDPNNANVLYLAGSFHLHRRDRARGVELLGRAFVAWPNFFATKLYELDRALGGARAVLDLVPADQPFLAYQYAIWLLDAGRVGEAREAFLAAVRRGGWRADWLVPFAGGIAARQSRAEALSLYDRMPEANRTALTEMEVVKLLAGDGQDEQARRRLVSAQARFPADPDLLDRVVAWFGSGAESERALAAYRDAAGQDERWRAAAGRARTAARP